MIVAQAEQRIHKVIESRLTWIGLNFVRNARVQGDYVDRTGNLRSSVGFMLLRNGKIIAQDWRKSGKGTQPDPGWLQKVISFVTQTPVDGMATGKKVAKDISKAHNSGWVLIVVAGMSYAAAVESRNYDVITNSSTLAVDELKAFISDLKRMAV